MKNFNGNDTHNWFNGLIYGTLMACSLATVAIFASEMVHFGNSPRLARWREQISTDSDPALADYSTAKTKLAALPPSPAKPARTPPNPVNPTPRS